MSATDPGNRSSADIERDVEQTRAGVASTLGQLRDRASPGQLFEQAVEYARGSGGGDFVRNLGTAMRDNPLPLVLIGAGIGWLMLSGGGDKSGRTGGHKDASLGHDPLLLAPPESNAADGTITRLVDGATDAAQRLGTSAGDVSRGLGDVAAEVKDTVARTADAAGEGLTQLGNQAGVQGKAVVDEARQGIQWLLREQPLVLGAIGVAIGAAVGAMLPGTAAEDRLMGESRDSIAERAEGLARDGADSLAAAARGPLEQARDAVGGFAQNVQNAAGEPHGARERLGDAARQGRETLREAAHDVAEGARAAIAGDQPKAVSAGRRPDYPAPDRPDQGISRQA